MTPELSTTEYKGESAMKNTKNNGFKLMAALILLLLILALLAPVIAPNDPYQTNLMLAEAPPSAQYPLGNDPLGRCMLSRIIYGARVSIFSSLLITIIVFAVGV